MTQLSRYHRTPKMTRAIETAYAAALRSDPATKRVIAPGVATDKIKAAAQRAACAAAKKRMQDKGTLSARCRAVLSRHGDMTAAQVAEHLGDVTPQQASNAMSRMRQVGDGIVVVGKEGYLNVWRYVGKESAVVADTRSEDRARDQSDSVNDAMPNGADQQAGGGYPAAPGTMKRAAE